MGSLSSILINDTRLSRTGSTRIFACTRATTSIFAITSARRFSSAIFISPRNPGSVARPSFSTTRCDTARLWMILYWVSRYSLFAQ